MNTELFVKGITYGWNSSRGDYKSEYGIDSMKTLKETNSDWIAISFSLIQDKFLSTKIYFDYEKSLTDSEIIYAIENAHKMGLKICLKPVVNPLDGVWRGFISFSEVYEYWCEWYQSYNSAMLHYAEIAEQYHCEMFCIGCEMAMTERRTEEWVHLIEQVRKVYKGRLTYNVNHDSYKSVKWWEYLDIISVSAYIEMKSTTDLDIMRDSWISYKEEMKKLYDTYHKPIIFMEIGCISGTGCSKEPWKYDLINTAPINEDEQALYYSAAFESLWN